MRIFVAAAGAEPHHLLQRDRFMTLAAADAVGRHRIARAPDEADAVLFVDLQQHPGDTFLRVLRRHPLVQTHRGRICVYDERDHPFVTFPGIYVAGTPGLARRRVIAGGPYPWLQTVIERSTQAPDLLFSFNGARTHAVRAAVLELEHPRGRLSDTTGISFFAWSSSAVGSESARAEYASTVIRSKFVLCPRGQGPSSFRLYETLGAGRVPVVISDDWLAPPRIDWSACAVRVAERDVALIPGLLARLEDRWPQMAAAAAATFDANFAVERLWDHYATSIADLLPRPAGRPWWAEPEVIRLQARRLRAAAGRSRELARSPR
jgi:hypothetical protein